tara:strand:+ start:683 stop:1453 length:771 start_codon:yes stop_codon:yes gene_type:complete
MATLLLKKSYLHKNLKEIDFKNLWNSHGVFTTMRIIGKPGKILFFKQHINNLIKSSKIYKIYKKDLKKNIYKIIKSNFNKNKKYDHLLRIALNNKLISISLRKRFKTKTNFVLHMLNYKRVKPEYKNLIYKKIIKILSRMDTSKNDVCLYKNKKILESGTSNLLFVQKNKIYSPISGFYKGNTFNFFSKKIKIQKKNIFIDSLNRYDEIILVGSGKAVTSVNTIKDTKWRRKSLKYYRILLKIYENAVMKCPRYNG